MLVAPNLIDFGRMFDNIEAKLRENIVVLCITIGILVTYLAGLVLSRRADRKDSIKVSMS